MSVMVYHGLGRCLFGVLAMSTFGSEVWCQTEVQVVKQVRLAFRPNQETADTLARKRSALQAAAEFDSPQIARTLIRAYGVLDREAGPLETRRQELLLRGGGSKMLAPRSDGASRSIRTDTPSVAHIPHHGPNQGVLALPIRMIL